MWKIWMGQLTLWSVRLTLSVIIAFTVVWAEVALAAVFHQENITYKVKVHHITHSGEGNCKIVPVVKKTGDPKLIYFDFPACDSIEKGDYLTLPDPAEYPAPDNKEGPSQKRQAFPMDK